MSIYLHVGRDMTVLMSRDVTDHLQLLLRKSGYYLHTSAEKEVVRTIKEKTCYLALNPQKEEKDQVGAWEEFRLPDGKVIRVCHLMCLPILMIARERTILGSRDPIQPRTHRTRRSRCSSGMSLRRCSANGR